MKKYSFLFFTFALLLGLGFTTKPSPFQTKPAPKIPVIFDTDANNELDDQHALAYLLFSGQTFAVEGITVNATKNGGNIDEQYTEAERVLKLCRLNGKIPLLKGANANFDQIKSHVSAATFDGAAAVNFIIRQGNQKRSQPLVLLAVGKLTNVALALQKDPALARKVRVVWLGSNYPEPGEYNQDNDTAAMNYVLNTRVPFEMVTVRYEKPSGTHAVQATLPEIKQRMPGKGPQVKPPVTGRHQVAFTNFGDYAINLFEHIDLYGTPPARALYDMAAVAIVKNPTWAQAKQIPSPILRNNQWVERPGNTRQIIVWENFNAAQIMADFYRTMDQYVLAGTK